MISFALLGIEQAGLEIEDPFGTDRVRCNATTNLQNDIPIEEICQAIDSSGKQFAESTENTTDFFSVFSPSGNSPIDV